MKRQPERVSIQRFRYLLEQHQLASKMLQAVDATLIAQSLQIHPS